MGRRVHRHRDLLPLPSVPSGAAHRHQLPRRPLLVHSGATTELSCALHLSLNALLNLLPERAGCAAFDLEEKGNFGGCKSIVKDSNLSLRQLPGTRSELAALPRAGAAAAADGHHEPAHRQRGARDAGVRGHRALAHALHRLLAAPARLAPAQLQASAPDASQHSAMGPIRSICRLDHTKGLAQ